MALVGEALRVRMLSILGIEGHKSDHLMIYLHARSEKHAAHIGDQFVPITKEQALELCLLFGIPADRVYSVTISCDAHEWPSTDIQVHWVARGV